MGALHHVGGIQVRYGEDNVMGTTHVGAVLQKIICLVAAFQSDDSIYICLKSS